ncbi:unnamed protein product [Caretta caretta]
MNKRGPLAKIWLAAHWEKKLTKTHIFECNLETTIEKIISPKVNIALRTSGHLLLGVVRIYHRKAKYLLADCSEALVKMKMAFRPGLVDLPEESFEAAYNSITLPEEFPDFDTQLPDLNAIDVAEHFTLNQSRPEDITLPEDYRRTMLSSDGNFGEETEILRGHSFFNDGKLISTNSLLLDQSSVSLSGDKSILRDDTHGFKLDGFGDEDVPGDMIENLLRTEQNSLIYDILDMEEEVPLSQELPDDNVVVNSSYVGSMHPEENHQMSETTLLTNEKEGFTLDPVDATEMLIIEESSYLQESAHTETERTITDDSFVLALQNGRNEDANKIDEAIDMVRNDQDSEERRWSKRTLPILNTLRNINKSGVSSVSFLKLCKNDDRKQVSAKFYSFLVLKKQLAIELTQCAPYADIIATVGPKFHTI